MRLPIPEDPRPTPDGRPEQQQPRWRRDFPIDWPDDEYVARRDLVKFMVLTSLAFVAGQLSLLAKSLFGSAGPSPAPQRVAAAGELPVGGAKVFEFPADSPPRLLVRLDESRYAAYDQLCTHLQCPVLPRLEDGALHCPCHNGWFDAETGRPTAGPPRRPLPRIELEVRDGAVYAVGLAEERS